MSRHQPSSIGASRRSDRVRSRASSCGNTSRSGPRAFRNPFDHDQVYFPHSGIISCVVELIGGGAIETGMIGRDGQFGAGPAMDHRVLMNHVVVQVAGDVSIIEGAALPAGVRRSPELRVMTLAYAQFMTAQIQQTAACNAVHKVPARICKWLLRMHRLTVGGVFASSISTGPGKPLVNARWR
jgi:hypothetical protein